MKQESFPSDRVMRLLGREDPECGGVSREESTPVLQVKEGSPGPELSIPETGP